MSSQANLKHASTEPAHLTGKGENANSSNKREGRRAAGRAAALRGASDSDCSGETASLSADSGETQNNLTTVVSPPAVVTQPRSKHAKSRSRRRGSEWEVLEGLKDGQRFERRPEVFNGYLHKKRKWPLKGWHKRYFVVDGGILVYARSPGDVARGRLHGSVDVGLSVISAKARRRRIDIDADEFIYHLRAKTMEAFHSWLNVLKVHRLYRQHLLTFGVRESVPRINVADDSQRAESMSRAIPFQLSWTNSSLSSMSMTSHFEEELTSNDSPIKMKGKSDKVMKKQTPSNCHPALSPNQSFPKPKNNTNSLGSPLSQKKHSKSQSLSNYSSPKQRNKGMAKCKNNSNSLGSPLSQRSKSSIKPNTLANSAPKQKNKLFQKNNYALNNSKVTTPNTVQSKKTNDGKLNSRVNIAKNNIDNSNKTTRKRNVQNLNTTSELVSSWRRKIDEIKSELTSSKTVVDRNYTCSEKKICKDTMKDKTDGKNNDISLSKITFSTLSIDSDSSDSSDISDNEDLLKNNPHLGEFMESMFGEKTKRIFTKDWLSKLQFQHNEFPKSEVGSYQGSGEYNHNVMNKNYTAFYGDTKRLRNDSERPYSEVKKCSPSKIPTESITSHTLKDLPQDICTLEDVFTKINDTSHTNNVIVNQLTETSENENKFVQNTNNNQNRLGVINVASLELREEMIDSCSADMRKDVNGIAQRFQALSKHLKESIIQKEAVLNLGEAAVEIDKLREKRTTITNTDMSSDINNVTVKESMERMMHDIILKTLQRIDENLLEQTVDNLEDGNDLYRKQIDVQEVLALLKKLKDLSVKIPEASNEIEMLYSHVCSLSDNFCLNTDELVVATTPDIDNALKMLISDNLEQFAKNTQNLVCFNPIKVERKFKNKVNICRRNTENSARKKANINIALKKNEKNKNRKLEPLSRSIKTCAINNSTYKSKIVDRGINERNKGNKTLWKVFVEKSTSYTDFKEDSIVSNLADEVRHMLEIKKSYSLHNIVRRDVGCQSCFHHRQQISLKDSILNNSTAQEIINELYQQLILPGNDLNVVDTEETLHNNVSYTVSMARTYIKGDKSLTTRNQSFSDMEQRVYCSDNNNFWDKDNIKTVNQLDSKKNYSDIGIDLKNQDFGFSSSDYDKLKSKYQQLRSDLDKNVCSRISKENESNVNKNITRTIEVNYMSQKTENVFGENSEKEESDLSDFSKFGKKVNLNEIPGIINKVVTNVFNFLSPFCNHDLKDHIYMRCDIERAEKRVEKSKSCFTLGPESGKDSFNQKDDTTPTFDVKKSASCKLFSILKNRKWRDVSDQDIMCEKSISGLGSPSIGNIGAPQAGFVSGTPGGRLASWIIESGGPLENASRELGQAQLSVQQLQRLLECLELQQQVHHDNDVSLDGASPNVKKDRRKFGLRKKKSASSKGGSVDLHLDTTFSHAALSALTAPPSPGGGAPSLGTASLPIACVGVATRPQSLPGADVLGAGGCGAPASLASLTPDHQLREDFTILAKDLVSTLKGIVSTLVCERARLRAAMETAESPPAQAALRASLAAAVHQNTELKNRLSRIHDTSDLAEISSIGPASDMASRQFQASLSYSSSCVSASEFFDAEEHEGESEQAQPRSTPHVPDGVIELEGDTSSEAGSLSSEEGSVSSDNSDAPLMAALGVGGAGAPAAEGGRRARLPCPRPNPAGPSLWNLLYKNIGKDLSQISMPVTINEPLNMLQRLCEELEYSELLDAAAECPGGAERAALVAAFAVSAYASSAHRAASKPFNPLLAETYECVRQDRGFRFISEQVSHHPPVSVCHAESPRWTFWQEARIRTKFWGKSMEFQPAGRVHVRLHATGEHYTWNKVTTCVHNLFGGQRWVDQYGDMHITSNVTYSCKLNFIKASSWSTSRHEVRGAVTEGGARPTRITGRWSEALYAGDPPAAKCLWRHGAMPPDHELYYGFTRFAMELNELESGLKEKLPGTDTRLRPDQRALEEGDVDTAEKLKLKLEQAQRERRRRQPYHTPRWFRKEVENGEEVWVFGGEYWKAREAGFPNEPDPGLW